MPAVTPTITSGGKAMDPAHALLSLSVWRQVNRIPQAELRVIDRDVTQGDFEIGDTDFFAPGAQIEIKLRHEGEPDVTVFKGIVVRHGVEVTRGGSVLVVRMKDAAVKLTAARRSAVFRKMTDSAIIKKLVGDAGLVVGTVPDTKPQHAEMVQYNATAWDFILSRADATGLLVVVEDGAISLHEMAMKGEPKHRFKLEELYDVELEADAEHQYEGIESVGWDIRQQKLTNPSKAKNVSLSPGNLEGSALGKAVGNGTRTLSHPVPLPAAELDAWANARMERSRMSLLRGRFATAGRGAVRLLDLMELQRIGKRFNGKALVTGIRHQYDSSGWQTDIELGLSPEIFARAPEVLDVPAAGLLPAVSGLQIPLVADHEDDPDGELRVKLLIPRVDAQKSGAVWARLAAPDAGKGHGFFFRPEPGDEVVVGFLDDDPRCPVILGALHGSKNAPAESMGKPNAKNDKKGIVTKKGTTIGFVDGDNASVYIETAKKNRLVLDDAAETVTLSDQHGNSITLGKEGVVLKSAKSLKIEASGDVTIQGNKVDIQ